MMRRQAHPIASAERTFNCSAVTRAFLRVYGRSIFGKFRAEDGSSLLELALLTPLLLLLFAGSVDLGQACFVAIEVSEAASAGAEYGTLNPTDTNGMQTAAALSAANLTGLHASALWGCECSDGTSASAACGTNPTCNATRVKYVAVNTSFNFVPVFGLPGLPSNLLLQSSSRLRAAD